jgi:hypothetical protein
MTFNRWVALCLTQPTQTKFMGTEWIDKIGVVERQLSEAIRLFFEERDPVVIYTIVASAHQILFDLARPKGFESAIKNTTALRKDDIQEFLRSINYPYNFFKHSDRDPTSKINITPLKRLTADFIMDAIILMQRLKGTIPFAAKVYWLWFVSKFHEEFEELPEDSEVKKMQKENLAEWDFPTIAKFLQFCDIVGAED